MKYFDLHCDTPYECYKRNEGFTHNTLAVSGEQGAVFEEWRQVFAIWIQDDQPDAFSFYLSVLKNFREKLKAKPPHLTPLFAVEGGAVIGNHLERVARLKEDGICALTLTWNGENNIAGGTHSEKGLTPFGQRVIAELNRHNIICDLSHLNEKSFYSAWELADAPVATHSNCRAVWDVPRNLTDDQLRLVGEKQGLIGLCFYPQFLGGNPEEMVWRHLTHLLDLGLQDCIAIGSDFDGADMHPQLDKLERVPFLYRSLREKGFSKALLEKVFWQNAKNYFDKRHATI